MTIRSRAGRSSWRPRDGKYDWRKRRLRARDNPFAVHRVLAERYRLDEAGWTRLEARLAALDNRGAIVGPHGSGKTTLLEDLADRLERRGERVVMLRFDSTE